METKIKIFTGSRREILTGILAISLVFGTFSLPQAENFSADISTFELNILDDVKPELTQKTADAENLIKKDTDTLTTDSEKFKSEIPKDSENSLMLGNSDSAADSGQAREELRYFNHRARIVNGTFSGNKIIYKDIWPHTDLLVTTLENGVKEDLILKNNQAPLQFEYLVETVGLRLELTPDGGYEFLDRFGKKKFYTPAPDLTDAAGQKITTGISYDLNWEENADNVIKVEKVEGVSKETETEEVTETEEASEVPTEQVPTEEEIVEPVKVARPRAVTPVETEGMEHETGNMKQEEVIQETPAEEAEQNTADSIQQTATEAEEISETLTEPVVETPTEEIETTPIDEITVVEEAETTPVEEDGQNTETEAEETLANDAIIQSENDSISTEEISEPTGEVVEPIVETSEAPVEEIPTEEVIEPVEESETASLEETPTEEVVEETSAEEVVEPEEEALTEPTEPVTNNQTAFFQKFLPKFLRADLLETGRQDFENSVQNSEQLRQTDGSILRRYKLKLTVANVAGLTYPLDLDPSTFVQTATESADQAAEEVSDPTAAVTTIGRNLTTNDLTVRGTLTTSGTNLSIDSGLLYMDSVNDRVGIGTTAPLSKLGLLGNFSLGATYGALAAPTSGLIVEGNVGIGTTNPSSKVEVNGDIRITTSSGGQIFFADGSSMSSAALGSAASLSNTTDAIITSDSDANASGDIILKTGSSDRLHILNSNGYVGIGTTAPTTALDVTGTVTATAFAGPLTGAVTGNATTATDTAAKTGTGSTYTTNTSPTFVTPVIGAATGTSLDLGATTLIGSRALTIDTGGVFDINMGTASGDDFTVDTSAFVVEGDTGNVGIGTTTPGAKLDISGGSLRTDTQLISTLAIGTAPLAVTSTTLVANLNADLLDGYDSSAFGDATAANQTSILTKIGANTDSASMSDTLFAGQQYIADNLGGGCYTKCEDSGTTAGGATPTCGGGYTSADTWSERAGYGMKQWQGVNGTSMSSNTSYYWMAWMTATYIGGSAEASYFNDCTACCAN